MNTRVANPDDSAFENLAFSPVDIETVLLIEVGEN